jgi:hypothetical protein
VSDPGRHFSGYSFVAVDKSDGIRFERVSGPKGGAHGCAEYKRVTRQQAETMGSITGKQSRKHNKQKPGFLTSV